MRLKAGRLEQQDCTGNHRAANACGETVKSENRATFKAGSPVLKRYVGVGNASEAQSSDQRNGNA